jgi:hypothetical protein
MSIPEAPFKRSPAKTALWALLLLGGLAAWLYMLSAGGDAGRAWRALLINFLYFTPLAAGMVTWSAVVLISHGRWDRPIERISMAGIALAAPTVITLAALWACGGQWAPWYGKDLPQGIWLNPAFVFSRDMAALVIFWLFAAWFIKRRLQGRAAYLGAGFVVVYCLVFSMIGFDLVMSLNPRWHSALFGGYFFISGMYIAVCAWTFITTFKPDADRDRLHDLGKLMVAFCMLTTYMMFSQLIVIWYENLPNEIPFLVPKMNYQPWKTISFTLLGVIYLGPIVYLLTVWAKRNPYYLRTAAALILTAMWVERWWLVAPVFERHAVFGITEIAPAAIFIGLFGLGSEIYFRLMPAIPENTG